MQTATADNTPPYPRCKRICGVYAWEHVPTGMLYIGSSIDCLFRKKRHMKSGRHFHRRATELGWENFTFRILEECAPELRLALEKDWIQKMNSIHPQGFNIQKDPTRFNNYVWTEEMRLARSKLSKALNGTPEARAANSARVKKLFSNPEFLKAHSATQKIVQGTPEARAAASARTKAQFSDPKARAANSARIKAYYSDPKARAAQSERLKISHNIPEFKAALSARLKVVHNTPEARAANSKRRKKWHEANPEFRAKFSTRMKTHYTTHGSPRAKSVNQYDMSGNFIRTFGSLTCAKDSLGVVSSGDLSTAARLGKPYHGFLWKFAD